MSSIYVWHCAYCAYCALRLTLVDSDDPDGGAAPRRFGTVHLFHSNLFYRIGDIVTRWAALKHPQGPEEIKIGNALGNELQKGRYKGTMLHDFVGEPGSAPPLTLHRMSVFCEAHDTDDDGETLFIQLRLGDRAVKAKADTKIKDAMRRGTQTHGLRKVCFVTALNFAGSSNAAKGDERDGEYAVPPTNIHPDWSHINCHSWHTLARHDLTG